MGDHEARYLGRVVGYELDPRRGLRGEPEAVTAAEQRRMTQQAHLRWRRQQARAWGESRVEILAAVEWFKANGRPDKKMLADVHQVERAVRRLDRRVAE